MPLHTLIIIHNTQIQTPAERFVTLLGPGPDGEIALPMTHRLEAFEFSTWQRSYPQYTFTQDFIHSGLLWLPTEGPTERTISGKEQNSLGHNIMVILNYNSKYKF